MTTRTFSRLTGWAALVLSVAFCVWTWLTFHTHIFSRLDATSDKPRLLHNSPLAQVASAIALVADPVMLFLALLIIGFWAWRRRLRHLAFVSAITGVLTAGLTVGVKHLVGRPRPQSPLADAITYSGSSYPSTHMTMLSATAIVLIAVTTTTRQSRFTIILWRFVGGAALILLAWDRWIMNAHRFSDIVGGALLGSASASIVMLFGRVQMLPLIAPPRLAGTARPMGGLCVIIYNPNKVRDMAVFRRQVEIELDHHHWGEPLWLPTGRTDGGASQAHLALSLGADLVIVAGGDGTVRIVASELAGSDIPVGIVPAGTGNLLAKNLGIPLDQGDAVHVAIAGQPMPIDLIRLVVDGKHSEPLHFSVMAGIGFDARLMERTNDGLKKMVGSAAYVFSAMSELLAEPHRVDISVDGLRKTRRKALLTVMGNVPSIGGGVELIPDADPTDGRLEMVVGSPVGLSAWAKLVAQVLTKMGANRSLEHYAGVNMSVRVDEPTPYELDGDTMGSGQLFEATVEPGALSVMVAPKLASQSAATR